MRNLNAKTWDRWGLYKKILAIHKNDLIQLHFPAKKTEVPSG